jgi:multicomponent Na+:H+ antiporter subunit B
VRPLILRTASDFLAVLLVVYSIFLLLRGHNDPGGGFIGGLLVTGAFVVYALGHGVAAARRLLRADPRSLIGIGLAVVFLSGCAALFLGRPFLTGLWLDYAVPGIGKVSTVLLFDVGVYVVVLGTVTLILFSVADEEDAS